MFEGFLTFIRTTNKTNKPYSIRIYRKAPEVSNLLSVDDSLIFLRARAYKVEVLKEVLHQYELMSGQEVTLEKSDAIFSASVNGDQCRALLHVLGMKKMGDQRKDLSLPVCLSPFKKVLFELLKQKVWKKINGWKEKILSQANREVLIKSVL